MKLKKITKVLMGCAFSISSIASVLGMILAWRVLNIRSNSTFYARKYSFNQLVVWTPDEVALLLSIPLCIPLLIQPHWKTILLAMFSVPVYFLIKKICYIV
ncbi:hypothetical protein Cylst_4631 [Cylindrospermum stagnale PCC 7417]|uniref:Uncharacterized protein n=1 Tax=Cylindrospermum stagnale PCC 7417 TaxID=56107 RepID=K9X3R7_9NOST|nr:hypothetical protein Cylst_4631 [Cylindrospermum stagnale PCC 7417]